MLFLVTTKTHKCLKTYLKIAILQRKERLMKMMIQQIKLIFISAMDMKDQVLRVRCPTKHRNILQIMISMEMM